MGDRDKGDIGVLLPVRHRKITVRHM